MSLKNIYNREDFKKVYEIFGGTQGGAGTSDGFANNAKLKDTYLGMLLNSMFKGVSWLWRKSKENFIINKMIGRLINELMRGVVVYCLMNNIDLKTGKKGEEIDNEEDNENTDDVESDDFKKKIAEFEAKAKTWSVETLESELNETKTELTYLEKEKPELEKQIIERQEKLKNKSLSKDDRSTIERNLKNSEEQLININNEIKYNNAIIPIIEKILDEKRKENNNDVEDNSKLNFKVIHDACVKKYNFDVESKDLPKIVADLDIINPVDFRNRLKKIPSKLILIGDEFSLKYGNKLLNVKVKDVNVNKNTVLITSTDENKSIQNKRVNASELLPKNFPNYLKLNKSIKNYLSKRVNRYSNLNDIEKQDVEKIYMAYSYLNKLTDEYKKSFGVVEDYDSFEFDDNDIIIENMLYEFNVKNTYNKSQEIGDKEVTNMKNPFRKAAEIAGTSGDVKIKPGEPKAGKISGAKSISQMAVSPTVGDILTKRDKQKYKDREDEFKTKIYDVNLAEIEKTIESNDKRNDVAKIVNPYNLKVIQITINQLFESPKKEDGVSATSNNNNLKLKWNKKVDNVYASFYKIMNTEYISKIMESASSITTGSEFDAAVKGASSIKNQQKAQKLRDKLHLTDEKINIDSLKKDNYYCWYNLSYTNANKTYDTVISPVLDLFKQNIPVFQLSPFFTIDDNSGDPIKDEKTFKSLFTSDNINVTLQGGISNINVYFLLYNKQVFPLTNVKDFKVLIINEIVTSSGKYAFLLMNTSKFKTGMYRNYLIKDDLLNDQNFNFNDYVHKINSVDFARFDKSKFESIKDKFGVPQLYPSGTKPASIKDSIVNVLSELSKKLS